MNIAEWAAALNGREYGEEISKAEETLAQMDGVVIVFGYSDDNMEIRWAINDEVGCYDGDVVYFDKDKVFEPCDCGEACRYSELAKDICRTVTAVFSSDEYTWRYETEIPHKTFDIVENGEKFCKWIVFHISSLR